MKITKIEAIPFRIPLRKVSRWGAHGVRDSAEHVLVRVHADSGLTGIAEAIPRPVIYGETQRSIVHIIDAHFAQALLGQDPFHRQAVHERLNVVQWNPTAKGAIDIALHDLMGQACGVSVAEFLGGELSPLPVSYMLSLGDVDSMLKEALEARDRWGITAYKIKAGTSPALDIERVRRLREALGAAAFIFIDANQQYSADVAIRTIRRMAEFDLVMAEEPVPIGLGRLRKKVADAIPVPILSDDSVCTLVEVRREIELGAIGVVGLKTPRTGIWESMKIIHLAEAHGMPCWMGSQGVSGIGTLASAHVALGASRAFPYPADLGNFVKQNDDLLRTPIELREGKIHLPHTPGLGASIDEEKLARYRLDG